MASSPSLARRIGLGAMAVVVVASLAACGSKSLVENFTAKITAADFQASGSIGGSMSVTAAGQTIDGTFSGDMKIKGKDSAMSMTNNMNGQDSKTDQVTVGDTKYSRSNDGAWTKSAKAASDTNIIDLLAYGVTDKGVQSHNGHQLHRLETAKAVDPSAVFSGSASSMTNVKLTLTFWAKDDGSPAGMTIAGSWTQDFSGTSADASMTLDYNFDNLTGVTIEAPSM